MGFNSGVKGLRCSCCPSNIITQWYKIPSSRCSYKTATETHLSLHVPPNILPLSKKHAFCTFLLPHGTLCGSGAGRPGCITYEAVNEAFLRGRRKVGLRNPHRSTTMFTLAQLGSALQETTRLLADRWVTSSRLERSQEPKDTNSVTVIITFNWREGHLFHTMTLKKEEITLSKQNNFG